MTMIRSRDGLAALVDELRTAASTTDDPACAVANSLRAALPATTLLDPTELAGRPGRRAASIHLHAEPAFSIVAIVWCPGQATSIHDHLAWCVVAVLAGSEHETTYRLGADDDTLVADTEIRNDTGSVTALIPPGDIHRVRNLDDGIAVSLHVYGTDLGVAGSSVRRVYDVHDGTLDIARIRGVR